MQMPRFLSLCALSFSLLPVSQCLAQTPSISAPSTPPAVASTSAASLFPADKWELRLDVPYADTENPRQKLDLYLPKKKGPKPLPVIVFIHGGGWKAGNKSSGAATLSRLVLSEQYIGVSLAYRLTQEAHWPAQIHDCKAAIRWLKAHAAELGADPDRIAVWGNSAGGHLASLLGTTGDTPELDGSLGSHSKLSTKVRCVINFYGPQNFRTMVQQESSVDRTTKDYPEALLLGGRVQDVPDIARAASPVTYVSSGDAPFFTAHGTKDPLVSILQARELHTALQKAGVESFLIEMTDAGHGFRSPELDQRIDLFLAKHLQGKPGDISSAPIPKGQ